MHLHDEFTPRSKFALRDKFAPRGKLLHINGTIDLCRSLDNRKDVVLFPYISDIRF